jgi:8-oxo-dGTP pyrophosphatase MutT (NUDIX family)
LEQRKILSPGRFDGSYLTPSFVVARLAERGLLTGQPGMRSDRDLDLNPAVLPLGRPLVAASVLVPLMDHPDGLTVLLTQRTAHLTDHAGQVSFPGGRQEPQDEDAVAAALRETREEIGLVENLVEVIGRLDTYTTSTGYTITPVVGLIRPPVTLAPDPFEVAEIFEVPLATIVDPANHQVSSREFQGRTRRFYVLSHESRYIWGATAGMLVNLAKLLEPA